MTETNQRPKLVYLSDQDARQRSTQTRQELLQAVASGLLQPSKRLSAAAATKLHTAVAKYQMHRVGELIKSLPVELLYDEEGLNLFDQITRLPEYYLTAAEADILKSSGRDIVDCCVRDGTTLLELGAGSMTKTKLLLDAVQSSSCSSITFAALDLCDGSLQEALDKLQDRYGSIRLLGLVGTYQQGLQYVQQQEKLHRLLLQDGPALHAAATAVADTSDGAAPAAGNNSQTLRVPVRTTPAAKAGTMSSRSSRSTCSMAAAGALRLAPELPATQQGWEHKMHQAAPAGPEKEDREADDADAVILGFDQSINSSTNIKHTGCLQHAGCHDSSSGHHACCCTCACKVHESSKFGLDSNSSSSSSNCGLLLGSGPKVIMWLGSSIGNCTRKEAAAFLKQIKQQAMKPGDFLLLGVDRRNDSLKVETAYNDSQGVTRAFILNGLHHCNSLLSQQLQADDSFPSAAAGAGKVPQSSLDPAAFEYFCLYNADLGRHEAYYRARHSTTIRLPLALAGQPPATKAAATTATGAAGSRPAGPGMIAGKRTAAVETEAAVAAAAGYVNVAVAAGELILIEYSYKYSQQEVQELAAAAGFKSCKAWSDCMQQYDLHLLQPCG